MSDLDRPNLFAVVTWGCAGTKWLSTVLNAHPKLFCVHSLRNCLRGLTDKGDEALMAAIDHMGLGYRAAGDVHGIARTSVPALRKVYGDRFRCVGLVREPVARLKSHLALFENYGWDRKLWTGMDYVQRLRTFPRIAHLATSYERLMVVHAANMLNTITEELPLFPVYRVEDLATPDVLRGFLEHLCDQETADDFLQWASDLQQNSHRRGRASDLEPWQDEIVRAVVLPESIAAYESLGYAWAC